MNLSELRRLHEAATQAKLAYRRGLLKVYIYSMEKGEGDLHLGIESEGQNFGGSMQTLHPADGREVPVEANAAKLVAAWNNLPALLEIVETAAEFAEAEDELDETVLQWAGRVFTRDDPPGLAAQRVQRLRTKLRVLGKGVERG